MPQKAKSSTREDAPAGTRHTSRAVGAADTGPREPPPAEELQRLVSAAEREAAAARAAVDEARASYMASLSDPDAATSRAARQRVLEAEVDADRADARAAELEGALRAACEAEAESDRQRGYAEARAAYDFAVRRLREYPALAEKVVAIFRDVAKAELLIAAANNDPPDGAEYIGSPEDTVRSLPGIPEVVIDSRHEDAGWYTTSGEHVWSQSRCEAIDVTGKLGRQRPTTTQVVKRAPQVRWAAYGGPAHPNVVVDGSVPLGEPISSGEIFGGSIDDVPGVVVRRTKVVEAYLPALPAVRPRALAASVVLPGFTAHDDPFWAPTAGLSDHLAVLREIDCRSNRPAPRDVRAEHRQPQTRSRLLPEPDLIAAAKMLAGDNHRMKD